MTEHRSDDQQDNSLGNEPQSGVAQAGVIDLFGFDQKKNEVLLVMNEPRPWDGSEIRLHELQEKFNAYVSFLLDGEMIGRASGTGRQACSDRAALCGNAR